MSSIVPHILKKSKSFVCIIQVLFILGYNFFMKKYIITLLMLLSVNVTYANEHFDFLNFNVFNRDTREIKSLLRSQVKYANKTNFDKFIATYDKDYTNSDGFNLETYSSLVKDIWNSYDKIVYGIKIKSISVKDDTADVVVEETSSADIPISAKMDGVLKSEADSVYHLKKNGGKWKVASDEVIKEVTSMLYGDARNLDIKLTAPEKIKAGEEYTASLEFNPPTNVIAIASIASDKVEYPQKPAKEVYRKFPEDNILERIFISNSDNVNEYVVASIGLTKADIEDLNIKLSLTGFGYKIVRVNVIPVEVKEENNDKNK